MSNVLENADREIIREQRRLRRKIKNAEMRNSKEKQREMKALEEKFGSKDTHVTVVTREFATSLSASVTENMTNLTILQDDFPFLGQKSEHKNKRQSNLSNEQHSNVNESVNNVKDLKKSKAPIVLDIKDIIKTEPHNLVTTKQNLTILHNDKPISYGNMLDSSQPIRMRGKHREIPRPKKPNPLKAAILKEQINDNYIPSDIEYCDNTINEELNKAISILVSEVVNFQEKLYKRDPVKGVSKRRYVAGFHEVKKYLRVGKIRLIIFVPDLKVTSCESILVKTINDLKTLANVHDIPYIFALSRRILGRLCLKNVPVSCVGILNYSGAEESYKKVLNIMDLTKADFKRNYFEENMSITDELSSNILNVLKS